MLGARWYCRLWQRTSAGRDEEAARELQDHPTWKRTVPEAGSVRRNPNMARTVRSNATLVRGDSPTP
jgi:hypothetical protein